MDWSIAGKYAAPGLAIRLKVAAKAVGSADGQVRVLEVV